MQRDSFCTGLDSPAMLSMLSGMGRCVPPGTMVASQLGPRSPPSTLGPTTRATAGPEAVRRRRHSAEPDRDVENTRVHTGLALTCPGECRRGSVKMPHAWGPPSSHLCGAGFRGRQHTYGRDGRCGACRVSALMTRSMAMALATCYRRCERWRRTHGGLLTTCDLLMSR